MNIHIATQGTSTPPILDGLRHYSVDELVLLHNLGSKRTALKVQSQAEILGIPTILEEIDMFDQVSIIEKIIEVSRRYTQSDNIFINMTGGTKLMSASATVGGYMIGATTYYVKEKANEADRTPISELIIELPLPKVGATDIKGIQQKILQILDERGMIEGITTVIRDEFETSAQLASYHVNELVKLNLVSLEALGRKKQVRITSEGRIVLRLLEKK